MIDTLSIREFAVQGDVLDCPETKVLSAEDERRLLGELVETRALLIAAILEATGSDDETPPTPDDFHRLIRAFRDRRSGPGEAATRARRLLRKYEETRDRIALANLRLVAYAARRYLNRGISLSDLIQEGFCGLLIGIDRFEPANGTRLATYALWWIKQALRRTVSADAYPVRLNPKLLRQIATEHEEISHGAQAPKPHVSATLNFIRCAIRPTVSLDAAFETGPAFKMAERSDSPANRERESLENGEYVDHMMRTLTPREQLVIRLRFGLEGHPPHSLSQISDQLNVSKERIRQIQEQALQKLRQVAEPAHAGSLRPIDTSGRSVRIVL